MFVYNVCINMPIRPSQENIAYSLGQTARWPDQVFRSRQRRFTRRSFYSLDWFQGEQCCRGFRNPGSQHQFYQSTPAVFSVCAHFGMVLMGKRTNLCGTLQLLVPLPDLLGMVSPLQHQLQRVPATLKLFFLKICKEIYLNIKLWGTESYHKLISFRLHIIFVIPSLQCYWTVWEFWLGR